MTAVNKLKWDAHLWPFIYNWRPGAAGNLSKYHLAIGNMRATGYRPKALFLGTSKMMGAGAGTTDGTAYTVGAASKTKTRYIADILTGRGLPVSRQSLLFSNGLLSKTLYTNYEARFSSVSDWVQNTGIYQSIGGLMMACSSPNTGSLTFSPEGTVDTVDVLYAQGSTAATFTISDGASVVKTVNGNGTNALVRTSATLSSRGTGKVININRTTANSNGIAIAGVIAYDSQTPAIEMVNGGRYGGKASDLLNADYPWSPFNAIVGYAPDITFLGFSANEQNQSVPVATFKTNVQSLITQGLVTGSVVLVVELMGSQPSWGDAATQASFIQALYDLADANDIPLINENGILSGKTYDGGYSVAQPLGLLADGIHENAKADAILGKPYADLLTA